MSQQEQKQSEIIGSTGSANISFSFTRQELEDLKRFLKQGENGKPDRVYLTLKSGYSTKSNKNYSMITVDIPQASAMQTHQPAPVQASMDVPF
jgi:hypothetical protein